MNTNPTNEFHTESPSFTCEVPDRDRPKKTASQLKAEASIEARPGWKVRKRTVSSKDGTLKVACLVGELAVDVRVGRGGGQTFEVRDPDALLEAGVIGSLIQVRSEVVLNG